MASNSNTRSDALQSLFVYVRDTVTNEVTRLAIPADTQVGLADNPSELQLLGSLALTAAEYSLTPANFATVKLTGNDTIAALTINTSSFFPSSISAVLPLGVRDGYVQWIKDESGVGSDIPINVFTPDGSTIDGSSTFQFSGSFTSMGFYRRAGSWHLLIGGGGGGGGTISGTIYADLYASYVLTSASIHDPNARVLQAGTNVTLIDGGPGGNLVVNAFVSSSTGWVTAYNVLWANEPNQTFSSDGGYIIEGAVLHLTSAINGSQVGLPPQNINGSGLIMHPSTSSVYRTATSTGFGASRLAALFRLRLGDVIPNFDQSTPVRVWCWVASQNHVGVGLETDNGQQFMVESFRSWDHIYSRGNFGLAGSSNLGTIDEDLSLTTLRDNAFTLDGAFFSRDLFHWNVFMLELTEGVAGDEINGYYGFVTSSNWPTPSNMLLGYHAERGSEIGQPGNIFIPQSKDFYASFCAINGHPSAFPDFMTTFGGFRVDFLATGGSGSIGPIGPQGPPGTQGISASFNLVDLPNNPYSKVNFTNGVHAYEGLVGTAFVEADNHVVATLTGSTFSGPVIASPTAGFTGSLTQLTTGQAYIVGLGSVTVTTGALGQVIISGSSGTGTVTSITGAGGTSVTNVGGAYTVSSSVGADLYAAYVVLSASTEDINARRLIAGSNVVFTDNGPGSTLIIAAQVTTTGSSGGWTDTGTGLFTTSSVSIDSAGQTATTHGADEFFFVSGTVGLSGAEAKKAVFGGDVYVSGSLYVSGGITGSLTRTRDGNAYIAPAGPGISVATNSLGQVLVGNTKTGDDKASYLVIAVTASLPNDRAITAGTGISFSDTGPGGTLTISATGQSLSTAGGWTDAGHKLFTTSSISVDAQGRTADQIGSDIIVFFSGSIGNAPNTPGRQVVDLPDTWVSGSLIVTGGLSGSLQMLADGITRYLVGSGSVTVSTASNGQVTVFGSASTSFNKRGTFASRPAPGTSGSIYLCTDGPLSFFDDGTVWQPYLGSMPLVAVPLTSSFVAINAGGRSTTESDSKGGIFMNMTNGVAADDFRLIKKSSPGGAYTHTVHMIPTIQAVNFSGAGILWRQSSNGTCQFFGIFWDTAVTGLVAVIIRTETASNTGASPTFTFSSDVLAPTVLLQSMFSLGIWLRQVDDGTTNRTWSYSLDGQNFVQLATTGRTVTITPDEIGLWVGNVNSAGGATQAQSFFDSWFAG
jgi:hypothetical protein